MTGVAYADFLQGVAREPDGPKIYSRWGFRKIVLNGETVLLAMSEEEFRSEMIAAGLSREAVEEKMEHAMRDCFTGGMRCLADQCGAPCVLVNYSSGWRCEC